MCIRDSTKDLTAKGVTLVAVSKTKPASDIQDLYNLGPVSYTHLDVYKRQVPCGCWLSF